MPAQMSTLNIKEKRKYNTDLCRTLWTKKKIEDANFNKVHEHLATKFTEIKLKWLLMLQNTRKKSNERKTEKDISGKLRSLGNN